MSDPKTYLVTGAAGFIGSHLSEAFIAADQKVIGIDNFDSYYPRSIKEQNLAVLTEAPQFTLLEGDIRDPKTLNECFKEHCPDVVVHLAARAGVRNSVTDPLEYTDLNVMGTVNLLSAAVDHGVERFVFGSSSSVYGGDNSVPFAEDQPIGTPLSPYAASKAAGEAYCYSFHHIHQLPVVCLRFFTVYGPRQRPDLAIHKFTRLISSGQAISVYGDGSASRDFTYVGDIVRGIMSAAQRPELGNSDSFEIINLGSDGPLKVLELVEEIERALGRKAQLEWQPMPAGDMQHTWANIEKARSVLQWEPQMSFGDGMDVFADWYQGQRERGVLD